MSAQIGDTQNFLCHLWLLLCQDGRALGFTDHDRDLVVEGQRFRASCGLSASAIEMSSGLSVDNSEILGALSDAAISESDLASGRFDHAQLRLWRVDWRVIETQGLRTGLWGARGEDTAFHSELFRGHIGEVRYKAGAFRAELRGAVEALNQAAGLAYGRRCNAVLGDERCKKSLDHSAFYHDFTLSQPVLMGQRFRVATLSAFSLGWFSHGRLEVMSGPAKGLSQMIRHDHDIGGEREIELWQSIRADLPAGTELRLYAGCDKSLRHCTGKFDNILNFRGFPHLPSEDWLTAYPRSDRPALGGRLHYGEAEI